MGPGRAPTAGAVRTLVAQIVPTTDDFAYGTQPYGANVIGYLAAKLGLSYGGGTARLHSGYGTGLAALYKAAGGTDDKSFVRRQEFAENVRVSAVVRLHPQAGVVAAGQFVQASVIARYQASSLGSDGTASVELSGADLYEFRAEALSSTTIRYGLYRWAAGSNTPTTLATFDAAAEDAGHFKNDVELSLTAVTDGSDVDLTATVKNLGVGEPVASVVYQPGGHGNKTVTGTANPSGPSPSVGTIVSVPASGQPTLVGAQKGDGRIVVLTHTDTGGSVITGAGRCGFSLSREVDHGGGNKTVMVCSSFQVDDLDAVTTAWRDEWQRTALALCESVTDLHGTVGRNLASDFSTDQASIETTNPLKRNTSEQAAELVALADGGSGVDMDGETAGHYLLLPAPQNSFPAPALPVSTSFSVSVWARLDDLLLRQGNVLYSTLNNASTRGFQWRIELPVGLPINDGKMEVKLGDGSSISTFLSGSFTVTPYEGTTLCWICTYKANANTATGEGRLRWYLGSFGAVTLIGEVAVPSTMRPIWNILDPHAVGLRDPNDSPATDNAHYLDGLVDGVRVFYSELTAAQAAVVADQNLAPSILEPIGLVHSLDFESTVTENLPGSDDLYRPTFPAGVSDTANWWRGKGSSTLLTTPGILPVLPAPLASWDQFPATSSEHTRSVDIKHANSFSLAGILVRGTPSADPDVWSGYQLDVAVGAPAPIALWRVLGGVKTLLAVQDTSATTVDVLAATYATVAFTVSQLAGAGVGGPVVLAVSVDGGDIVFEPVGSGVSIDIDGNAVDVSSSRIVSGTATGILSFPYFSSSLIDNWSRAAVETTPNPDEYPNLVLPAEADGAFGDLSTVMSPEHPLRERRLAPRVSHEMDSGHEVRLALGTYEPRAFDLVASMDGDEYAAFLAFWDAHDGSVLGFNWTPNAVLLPWEGAGVWHFLEDSLEVARVDRVYRIAVTVEERRAGA